MSCSSCLCTEADECTRNPSAEDAVPACEDSSVVSGSALLWLFVDTPGISGRYSLNSLVVLFQTKVKHVCFEYNFRAYNIISK